MENNELGHCIAIISKYWGTKINHEVSKFNINKTQVEILGVLFYFKGLSQNELGEKLFLDKITVTKNLQGLIKQGFVEKKRSEEDRRVKRLYLTPKTEGIGKEIKAIIKDTSSILTRGFSREEKNELMKLMGKMVRNIFDEVFQKEQISRVTRKSCSETTATGWEELK